MSGKWGNRRKYVANHKQSEADGARTRNHRIDSPVFSEPITMGFPVANVLNAAGRMEFNGEQARTPLDADNCRDIDLLADALTGVRGVDQARIAVEVLRWGAMLLRKNRDYGSSAWQRPLLAPDCDSGVAIRVRMSDKINRLVSLLEGEAEIADESVDDTLRDLGAYCLLELARPGRSGAKEEPALPQAHR